VVRRRQRDAHNQLARKIRDEARDRGLSAYALARAAGLPPQVVQRFLYEHQDDVMLSTASRLCAALSLRLDPTAARRSRARAADLVDVDQRIEDAGGAAASTPPAT
jgi:DNA-binding Xre family transcriptional regulator